MICSVSVSGNIEILLEYVLASRDRQGRGRDGVVRLGGPAGRSFDGIVNLFEAHKRLRPSLGRHVGHASLRLSPRDRHLTRAEWRRAAGYLASGFGAEAWTTIGHGDDHVHILWSRIRRDGTLVDHRHDRRRAEILTREIERTLGLEQVPCSWQLDPGRMPAVARPVVPEMPESVARREAVWVAWQASEDGTSTFLMELERHAIQLTFDEEHRFCVDLGHNRREPLVRLLVRCALRDGYRPPRERQILAGLDGMRLDTLGAPKPEHARDASMSTSDERFPATTDVILAPSVRILAPVRSAMQPKYKGEACPQPRVRVANPGTTPKAPIRLPKLTL